MENLPSEPLPQECKEIDPERPQRSRLAAPANYLEELDALKSSAVEMNHGTMRGKKVPHSF